MARRNDHSRDQIRSMALDAAERIVDVEGTGGLSARKVAAAIGYTVGTLYLVFDNLDDLVLQLNARTLAQLLTQLEQAAAACDDARRCIKGLGRTYLDFARTRRARWSLLFEHRLPDEPAVPEWFRAQMQQLFGLVERRLGVLMPSRSRAELRIAARALWSGGMI